MSNVLGDNYRLTYEIRWRSILGAFARTLQPGILEYTGVGMTRDGAVLDLDTLTCDGGTRG